MIEKIYNYKYYLIDLDDTIFSEADYLFFAYNKIDIYLSSNFLIQKGKIYNYLKFQFRENGRHKLFNKMIKEFKLDVKVLDSILSILRGVKFDVKISMYPQMFQMIENLIGQKKRIFIVTNGNIYQQKNKVNSIDWRGTEKNLMFIYANSVEPKPSKKLFYFLKTNFNINEPETLMIGNDYDVDRKFAENSNIDFIDVREILLR